MSDPTARRGDHVTALLDAMKRSRRGWSKQQMKTFLFKRYRGGVREQTLDAIIAQLKDHTMIHARRIRKHANIFLWYVVDGEYPQP